MKLYTINISSINIKDIDRPFSILLKSAHIKDLLNSTPFRRRINRIFEFRVQLCTGSQPFTKPYRVTWKNSTKDANPELNKRIYFDVNYNQLPNFCSILFKVKFIQYDENDKIITNMTKYWCNFKLFDHNLRLKCGTYKLNLYSGLFTDDAYYYITDSDEEEKSSKIYFEIEHFPRTVYNKMTHIKNYSMDLSLIQLSDTNKSKIEEIRNRSPFEELNIYDKETLWSNRYKLSNDTEMLSKLLLCVDYSNPNHLIELEKILELSKELNSTDCIGLLGGKFLHESIRNFAVKCLKNAPYLEIQEYLFELMHGLRYEIHHDNPLARFLLGLAIKHPVTIGHTFYWGLKSQIYEQNFQQRFGLYLEIFLNKIGPNLTKIFFDEDLLLLKLEQICEEQKNKQLKKKDIPKFSDHMNSFNESISKDNNIISLPINFKYRIKKIDISGSKIMKKNDKHLEIIFNCQNVDPLGDNILLKYCNDEDVRMTMVTMELFNILHTIWCDNDLKLIMPLYNVVATGRNKGIIQLIPDSQCFDDMPIKETAGFKNIFGKKSLRKYLMLYSETPIEECYNNFISSNAAYCCANYILGVTQRNKKNIYFKKNGEIYYTSYNHLLNHYSKILGDRGIPFLFNITFVDFLNENEERYKMFKELLNKAFLLIRKNAKDLIKLMQILLSSGLPEISTKGIYYLQDSLALNKTEDEAKELLKNVLSYITKH